jgi:hypothetical protein
MAAADYLNQNFAAGAKGRTQAEHDYGTGARIVPPQLHEMSPQSQSAVRAGFKESMSGWKSREQDMLDSGASSALKPGVVNRLDDRTVDIEGAGRNVAGVWDRMMASDSPPDPSWYFGHHRRLAAAADRTGLPKERVMNASAAMSPQNDPDSEYRAASAMADAVANRRQVTDTTTGKRKALTSMSPDEMQEVTSSANVKNVKAAKDFDLAGFRNAGTNRKGGWATIQGQGNAVAEMETAKVPLYAQAIQASVPDTPLHAEYEARYGDQAAARKVRLDREADASANRQGSETIRGVPDRVDTYGLMKGSDDLSDPASNHPILGARGIAVPDTWMAGLMSGQDMRDTPESVSPGKMGGSQTKSTSSNVPGNTFMGPKEAEAAGGKKFTGNAAWGMGAVAAIQHAATLAREPGSQTSIPPVMMQEMTWTHGRGEVAQSARESAAISGKNPGAAANRVKKLTGGTLAGEKEFRPATGARQPQSVETPGLFHRGSDNPLDTDSVRIVPASRSGGAPSGRNPAMDAFHARATQVDGSSELAKRRAIKGAIDSHSQERAARGVTAHPDPRRA